MQFKTFILAFPLALCLAACLFDDSSSATEKSSKFVSSTSDAVTCVFKDSTQSFDMTLTFAKREVLTTHAEYTDNEYKLRSYRQVDDGDKICYDSENYSNGKSEKVRTKYQNKYTQYKELCEAVDGKTRADYDSLKQQ